MFAVDNISLELGRGDFVSVLGPTGCGGETTLMLIVAGLLGRSLGMVRIDGQAVARPYTDLGIVFQDAQLRGKAVSSGPVSSRRLSQFRILLRSSEPRKDEFAPWLSQAQVHHRP